MELLIITQGDTSKSNGLSSTYDGSLTEAGLKQATLTGAWLNYNYNLNGYVGFTSPMLASLLTSSLISTQSRIKMTVNSDLRDFRFFDVPQEGYQIENRSILFSNLHWPVKEWDQSFNSFSLESAKEFVNRCFNFISKASTSGYDKILVVANATTAFILSELAVGKTPAELIKRCNELMTLANHPNKDEGRLILERHIMISGISPCGLTLVKKAESIWFSKVVYNG